MEGKLAGEGAGKRPRRKKPKYRFRHGGKKKEIILPAMEKRTQNRVETSGYACNNMPFRYRAKIPSTHAKVFKSVKRLPEILDQA